MCTNVVPLGARSVLAWIKVGQRLTSNIVFPDSGSEHSGHLRQIAVLSNSLEEGLEQKHSFMDEDKALYSASIVELAMPDCK